jgi:hypothetical protein
VTLAVQNPDQFKVVKKGDQVDVTYTEALAVGIERRCEKEAGEASPVRPRPPDSAVRAARERRPQAIHGLVRGRLSIARVSPLGSGTK